MGDSNDNGVPRPNARIFNISNKLLVPNQRQLSTLKHLSVIHLSKVRLGRLCRVTPQGEYIYFFYILAPAVQSLQTMQGANLTPA